MANNYTSFEVIVNFNASTTTDLNQGKYVLCCLLCCQSNSSGYPLIWDTVSEFLESTRIAWKNRTFAYISTSALKNGNNIYIPQPLLPLQDSLVGATSGSSYLIDCYQRMTINENNQITIDTLNKNDNIDIVNNTTNRFTAGIGEENDQGMFYGTCAFDLFGNNSIVINSADKIFLTIAQGVDLKNNSVLTLSPQEGVLIDMSKTTNNTCSISYDINTGWDITDRKWATLYDAGTNLCGLLVTSE